MLRMGHHFGWKVLYIIHSRVTIRKYEKILDIKIRDIFAETGPSSYRSLGYHTNFTTGNSHSFGGRYLEMNPNEQIRYTDKCDDANLPGEMQVTVTFKKVSCGTELTIVQVGVPDVIPAEQCYLGWQ